MFLLRTDCQLDANFFRPFTDDYIHDVGHANSGYEKREQTDQAQKNLDSIADHVGFLLAFKKVPHRQGTLIRRIEFEARAQHLVDPLLRLYGSLG